MICLRNASFELAYSKELGYLSLSLYGKNGYVGSIMRNVATISANQFVKKWQTVLKT